MKYFLFFSILFFAFSNALAQSVAPIFPDGEKLTYNLSFATFADAGSLELTALEGQKLSEREVNVVRARLRTTGIVQSTLLDLNSESISFLDPVTNLPVRFESFLFKNGKQTEVSHEFPENQVVSQSASPASSVSNVNSYDLLSAIYQIRQLDLTSAVLQPLKIWDHEKVYETKLRMIGRETVSTSIGAINTLVVQISTDDKIFNRYKTKIYVSDDARHLPVLLTFKLPQGEIRAELVSVEVSPPEPPAIVVVQPTPPPPLFVSPTLRPAPTPKPYFDNQPLDAELPFALGEILEFEILRANQAIGKVRLAVRERKQIMGRDTVLLSATAQSLNNSNVFSATDKIESLIDPNYLVPFRQEIRLSKNLASFNQSLVFEQERGTVTTDKGVRAEIPVGTHDALSFVYALRAFRFSNAPKDSLDTRAAVFLGGAPVIVTLKPTRETIEFGNKKTPVIALTVVTGNPQIDSLKLKLWLTDDARRLPLKLIFNTPLGVVEANLVKF